MPESPTQGPGGTPLGPLEEGPSSKSKEKWFRRRALHPQSQDICAGKDRLYQGPTLPKQTTLGFLSVSKDMLSFICLWGDTLKTRKCGGVTDTVLL